VGLSGQIQNSFLSLKPDAIALERARSQFSCPFDASQRACYNAPHSLLRITRGSLTPQGFSRERLGRVPRGMAMEMKMTHAQIRLALIIRIRSAIA
jgi:hypothetical protein